jgi:hypothetical protein
MTTPFFSFHNDQTYHLYKWVRAGGLGALQDLIAAAYDRAPENSWFEMGLDVCMVVRDQLALLLKKKLYEIGGENLGFPLEELGIDDSEVQPSWKGFAFPLLGHACDEIYYETAAEALLRDARKWAPDPEPPKIE